MLGKGEQEARDNRLYSPLHWGSLQGHASALTMGPSTSCPVPADSITVFTGQCFVDEDGREVLKTMWLLRSRVDNVKDDWKATRVGINVFTRLNSQKE
ncbi:avidin-like [Limosa lapponica baueri]|uniref:Avidin n=1 Tax=Limosa lapponica baueri TaxID=1758121 RepID=A0A2I0TXK7_LIMLA|nr:avidin-like [Limosa lapponica baueri]